MIGAFSSMHQDPLRIRRGTADDLDPVLAIMDGAFAKGFGERWTRSQCSGILPMPGVRLSVAEAGGQTIAFSLMRTILDESELLLIAVGPQWQGRGIGRMMLEEFMTQARSAGAARLHLEVRDGNPAVGLYNSLGFRIVGRRRAYYRGPDGISYDALTMMVQK